LVELHNGQIWAASPGLGQGATFFVAIPVFQCLQQQLETVDHEEASTDMMSSNGGVKVTVQEDALLIRNVLVVDDAPLSRKMVSRILTGMGCVCTEAADGEEAVQAITRSMMGRADSIHHFHAVFMDFEMPGKIHLGLIVPFLYLFLEMKSCEVLMRPLQFENSAAMFW
jgi:CheY-like chemotaxis protein